MNNLIGEFLYHIEMVKRQSQSTIRAYKKSLEDFSLFIKKPVENVTKEDVNNYVLLLSKQKTNTKTKNLKLIPIRSFLNYCLLEKDLTCLSSNKITLFKQENNRELSIPNKVDLKKFLEASTPATTEDLMVNLLFCTGMRASEILSLTPGQVQETFSIIGKGDKRRLIFCPASLVEKVRQYEAEKKLVGRLFPMTSGNLRRIFRMRSKRLKMEVHPHTLRHCFATTLLQNDTNLKHVQDMMGHASILTTQIYLHVSDEELKSSHKKAFML
jgi:site-specific recombinase XerD